MALRREHIYAVKNILSRGPASDDDRLSERLIGHMLNTSRAILLKRKMDKERSVNETNYQVICLPLTLSNFADCPNCNLPNLTNCQIMKSTMAIPRPITTRWGMSIRVRKIDGTIISPLNMTNKKYSQYSLASNTSIGWLLQGSTLFVIGPTHIPLVLLEVVLENPEDISSLDPCANVNSLTTPCFMLDEDFPIDPDLVMPMYQLTIQLLGYANSMIEDKVNDSSDPNVLQKQRNSNSDQAG